MSPVELCIVWFGLGAALDVYSHVTPTMHDEATQRDWNDLEAR